MKPTSENNNPDIEIAADTIVADTDVDMLADAPAKAGMILDQANYEPATALVNTQTRNHRFWRLSTRQTLILAAVLPVVVFLGLAIFMLRPQKVTFSYASDNCYGGVFLLPSKQKISGDNTFIVKFKSSSTLLAKHYCLEPGNVPKQDTKTSVTASLFGVQLLAKKITIETPKYPGFDKDLSSLRAIPVAEPIALKLASPDTVFGFALSANSKSVACQKTNNTDIKCDPSSLELKHATEYDFAVNRVFDDKTVQTVDSEKIITITPIVITNSSIVNNSIRYDKPKSIIIDLDKPVQSVGEVKLISTKDSRKIPTKTKYENNRVTIEMTDELARGEEYKLTIDNIHANDGGSLITPYELIFSTSNGPKVVGVNIGKNSETVDKNIIIRFDQNLDKNQDVAKHIVLNGGGKNIGINATVSSANITIRATDSLPSCTEFTIAVDTAIVSEYGISGASGWNYSSRTECFTSFSIGNSVEGRAIMAHRFGSGANAVLYVAGVHGNEQNATKLLYKWLDEINANPGKVPAGRSIVVIPSVNPDGYAKARRVNAHGIDLNRNFAANNWKSTIKEPSGEVLAQGGGTTALSEPESSALASYVSSLRPLMVMSYHSYGGLAIANDAGASRSLASAYGAKGGYVYKNGDTIGNTFDYDTTGAFEDWLYDKLSTPAILVELRSQYNDEFSSNVGPMWTIAQTANF